MRCTRQAKSRGLYMGGAGDGKWASVGGQEAVGAQRANKIWRRGEGIVKEKATPYYILRSARQ